jgi:hypothetical protein
VPGLDGAEALDDRRQRGAVGALDEDVVRVPHHPLVDEAGGHVHGHDGHAASDRLDRAGDRAAALDGLAGAVSAGPLLDVLEARLAVRLEHGVDRVGDPVLLERPRDEERGDAGVLVRRGDEQVAEVLHRRALEAAEVAQEAELVRAERRGLEGGQVELGAERALGGQGELADVEGARVVGVAIGRHGCVPPGDLIAVVNGTRCTQFPDKTVS